MGAYCRSTLLQYKNIIAYKMEKTKKIDGYPYDLYERESYAPEVALQKSIDFHEWMDKRRSVREFSDSAVPRELIDHLILSASTAPSGAHKQPWTFCVISDQKIKKQIREAAEEEDCLLYTSPSPRDA